MKALNEIIKNYLSVETSYALMITGSWGAGKTYYYKNVLRPEIAKTPVLSDNIKQYRPIHISLFGLSSIEEVQSEIFLALYPLLKNTKFKLAFQFGRGLLKGLLRLKGLDDYMDYIDDFKVDTKEIKKQLIKMNELVLCFDDLERRSPRLDLSEFIGYLNTLIDNDDAKILIIANEGKIKEDEFSDFREKVIGHTISYKPRIEDLLDSILDVHFAGDKAFHKAVQQQRDFIIANFKKHSDNLRIFIYALRCFQRINSSMEMHFREKETLKQSREYIMHDLFLFTMAVSIEYREANLASDRTNKIETPRHLSLASLFNDTSPEEDDGQDMVYSDHFVKKYFSERTYLFFPSIYQFITGGADMDASAFVSELRQYYHIEKTEVLPQYQVFQDLHYQQCFSLSDREYVQKTREMLDYAYQGKFGIANYMSVFHFAVRFGNPLHLNKVTLKKNLIRGMKKRTVNLKYDGLLSHHLMISTGTENFEDLAEIRAAALEINQSIKEKEEKLESLSVEALLYSDFEGFSKKILDTKEGFFFEPTFANFNTSRFYHMFRDSTSGRKWEIISMFEQRAKGMYESHYPEIRFFSQIQTKVKTKADALGGKGVSGFLWQQFEKTLSSIIDKLVKYAPL